MKTELQKALEQWNENVDEDHKLTLASNYEGVCVAHTMTFHKGYYYRFFSKFIQVFNKVFVVTDREEEFIDAMKNALFTYIVKKCTDAAKTSKKFHLRNNIQPITLDLGSVTREVYKIDVKDND